MNCIDHNGSVYLRTSAVHIARHRALLSASDRLPNASFLTSCTHVGSWLAPAVFSSNTATAGITHTSRLERDMFCGGLADFLVSKIRVT